jgi:type II secretory pathway component GspD/PulD (secretin)
MKTALCAVLLSLSTLAVAAPLDKRVTVQIKDAPVTTFLDTLSSQAKINFILTEGFTDKRVNLDVKNVPISKALRAALTPAGLEYRRLGTGNNYLVTSKGAKPAGSVDLTKGSAALKKRVKVDVRSAPIDSMFATIGAQAQLTFTVAPEVGSKKMTMNITNLSVGDLLEILAETKGLRIKQTGPDQFTVDAFPKG